MGRIDRLPALPLIVNDPYFSIWMPANTLNEATTVHWSGASKDIRGFLTVDGREYCWLGKTSRPRMETTSLRVYPTRTESTLQAGGVALTVTFWAPALPDDLNALSTPITFLDYRLTATDEKPHAVALRLQVSGALCYDGEAVQPLTGAVYARDGLNMAYLGQTQQHVLGHSGDHVTIDWGYLYLAGEDEVSLEENSRLVLRAERQLAPDGLWQGHALLGYDDIAAINYFGVCCRAWYQRSGCTLPQAMVDFHARHDALLQACKALDERILTEAEEIGGEDYALIAAAAWRHTLGAHKLIATPQGEMALLSKENDSNGCIGTVDLSYPSAPFFLKYCPELVNAMCRPVLEFAALPVWEYDFAPHDVGRYPYATGQVYGAPRNANGLTPPPYYQYPAGTGVYALRKQMPVEECGNMLILLEAALTYGASDGLARRYLPTLEKWVRYLDEYGEDPGEQLCTDDFAGHLAHNVNLSAKALIGVACFARTLERLGRPEEARRWHSRAQEMAQRWLERAQTDEATALTFDGQGWSMKYNLVWDLVLGLELLPCDFYRRESESYLQRQNDFGLPLDSRADYTKSDWLVWSACLAQDQETFARLIVPLARYLRTTATRVPFSDWYDTKTGRFVEFIARSVQGGVYMPMVRMEQKE